MQRLLPQRSGPLLVAVLLAAFASHAASTSAELLDALEEMEALEAEIESVLASQSTRGQQIDAVSRDLTFAGELMRGARSLRTRGRQTLENMDKDVARDLRVMEETEIAGRLDLGRARRGIEVSAPLLLHEARRADRNEVRELALGLLHARHREQARLGVANLLRLEQLRSARLADRERLERLQRRHASFAGLKVEDLRSRHRELSGKLNRLHSEAEKAAGNVLQLNERRRGVNELIARLSAPRSAERELASAPAPSVPSRSSALPPAEPARAELAEVPYEEQTELKLGTREGNGRATVQLEITAEGDRRLFWRARGARVHALARGTVLFAGPFAGYRHLLVIDHGGGWTSVVGNLTSSPLAEGDRVASGAVIGQYRAGENEKAEPLWFEARKETLTAPIGTMPGAEGDWEGRLFATVEP